MTTEMNPIIDIELDLDCDDNDSDCVIIGTVAVRNMGTRPISNDCTLPEIKRLKRPEPATATATTSSATTSSAATEAVATDQVNRVVLPNRCSRHKSGTKSRPLGIAHRMPIPAVVNRLRVQKKIHMDRAIVLSLRQDALLAYTEKRNAAITS